MHDTLEYIKHEPIHRKYHHNQITFSILYAWSENYMLPLSHDEVVHGKGSLLDKIPGDRWQKMATLRALYGFMWAHPGKQLIFMGCEFGQNDEWSESRSLDWHLNDYDEHRGIQLAVKALNEEYAATSAIWDQDCTPDGFQWLVGNDGQGNTLAFARFASNGETLVSITNFSPVPHEHYRLYLPHAGEWREVLNTDDLKFGGSGVINTQNLSTDAEQHAVIRLAPLATVWLKRS